MLSPNIKAMNTTSLYHLCHSVLYKLSTIEGMTEYIEAEHATTDPLLKITNIFSKGYPLIILYNTLNSLQINVDPAISASNQSKFYVYHFIVNCKEQLGFNEDDLFGLSDLYKDDTNGYVKVVHTINKILNLLEEKGIISVQSTNRNSDPNAPKNTRDKVALELLETERKYVQDMEILQNYMRELQIQKIVTPDTIHYLFGNLNALVDFQRRFLIQLEEISEKAPKEQRIGSLFIQFEDAFSVYEPYCVNYYSAQDLVVQETSRLQKLADILNPVYELPSMLIKPVQRICKYPLLLNELLKSTPNDWPYFQEVQVALECMKRVTEKINETQRKTENQKVIKELKTKLDNEEIVDNYGQLLLQDKLVLEDDREYHVFFFDKVLLFCKESKNGLKKKRRGSLVPKMIFQINHLTLQSTRLRNGVWSLTLQLQNEESLIFNFKNEEQVKLWSSTLSKAIENEMNDHHEDDEEELFIFNQNELDDEEEEEDFIHHQQPGMNLSPLPRMYYPITPPPSYPSSPITAAKVTNKEEPLRPLKATRSQSQSIASTLPIQPNRLRSKSSPNISNNNEMNRMMKPLPPVIDDTIKIKLLFDDGIYVITTDQQITFNELMEKVNKKIKFIANLDQPQKIRLKYKDEDGDLITINSDDDIQMAFESKNVYNTTTLFASL